MAYVNIYLCLTLIMPIKFVRSSLIYLSLGCVEHLSRQDSVSERRAKDERKHTTSTQRPLVTAKPMAASHLQKRLNNI